MPTETFTIDAPAEDHDAILLDRVRGLIAKGPVSYLRANKPVWRLEITRHDPASLSEESADAVADSELVLELVAAERAGSALHSRRELLLRAMRRVTEGLGLTQQERGILHREGYLWAMELGRWDDDGIAALERRYLDQHDGMTRLLASAMDAASEKRWTRLARAPSSPDAAIEQARRTIGFHANRLGVFAEAEAILHYFLFRLDAERERA